MVFPFVPSMGQLRAEIDHCTSQQQLSFLMKSSLLSSEDKRYVYKISTWYQDKIVYDTNALDKVMPGLSRNEMLVEMQHHYAEINLLETLLAKKILIFESESGSPANSAQNQLRVEVAEKFDQVKRDVLLPFQRVAKWRELHARPVVCNAGMIGLLCLTPAQKKARSARIFKRIQTNWDKMGSRPQLTKHLRKLAPIQQEKISAYFKAKNAENRMKTQNA